VIFAHNARKSLFLRKQPERALVVFSRFLQKSSLASLMPISSLDWDGLDDSSSAGGDTQARDYAGQKCRSCKLRFTIYD
jgi:hypothetical protein